MLLSQTDMGASVVVRAKAAAGYRAPVDLVLVVEMSQGVRGELADRVREAVIGTIQTTLTPQDRLSVITYGSRAKCVFRSDSMTLKSVKKAVKAVGKLKGSGMVNFSDALELAVEQLRPGHTSARSARHLPPSDIAAVGLTAEGRLPAVVVISCSRANVKRVAASDINDRLDALLQKRRILPSVSIVGVGGRHSARMLWEVARGNRGSYSYCEKAEDLSTTLRLVTNRVCNTVAAGVRVSLGGGTQAGAHFWWFTGGMGDTLHVTSDRGDLAHYLFCGKLASKDGSFSATASVSFWDLTQAPFRRRTVEARVLHHASATGHPGSSHAALPANPDVDLQFARIVTRTLLIVAAMQMSKAGASGAGDATSTAEAEVIAELVHAHGCITDIAEVHRPLISTRPAVLRAFELLSDDVERCYLAGVGHLCVPAAEFDPLGFGPIISISQEHQFQAPLCFGLRNVGGKARRTSRVSSGAVGLALGPAPIDEGDESDLSDASRESPGAVWGMSFTPPESFEPRPQLYARVESPPGSASRERSGSGRWLEQVFGDTSVVVDPATQSGASASGGDEWVGDEVAGSRDHDSTMLSRLAAGDNASTTAIAEAGKTLLGMVGHEGAPDAAAYDWVECFDPATNASYWYSAARGESTWDDPHRAPSRAAPRETPEEREHRLGNLGAELIATRVGTVDATELESVDLGAGGAGEEVSYEDDGTQLRRASVAEPALPAA